MEKEPTPIARGEQIGLEKELVNAEILTDDIKALSEELLEIRKQIEMAHEEEMKKPEWARRQNVLDTLQDDFEENNRQIDILLNSSVDVQSALDYIEKRHKDLEKRKTEEGY